MIEFTCTCKERFLVGKKRVYGPIYPFNKNYPIDQRINAGFWTRKEWADNYAECYRNFVVQHGYN